VQATAEGVGLDLGHVGVDNDNGEEALALVEDLHAQGRRVLGHGAVEDGARLDLVAAELELDVHDGLKFWQQVRHNVELLDTLHNDLAVHGTPLAVSQVAVDGLVHVAYAAISRVRPEPRSDKIYREVPPPYPCRPQSGASPQGR